MSEAADTVRWLKTLGLTENVIADQIGIKQSSVNDWVNKGATPSSKNMDRLRELAQTYKMLTEQKNGGNVHELRRVSIDEEHREEEEYLNQRQIGYSSDGGYVPTIQGALPEIDVMVGAGSGTVGEVINLKIGEYAVSAHPVTDEWKFPEGYLSSVLNVSSGRSLILPVIGDSMAPTYYPGDRVVVDLRQNEMSIDAVYVISDGESPPQIKRLQRVMFSKPAMVDIISDNPAHQSQRVELGILKIIGRIAGKVSKQ